MPVSIRRLLLLVATAAVAGGAVLVGLRLAGDDATPGARPGERGAGGGAAGTGTATADGAASLSPTPAGSPMPVVRGAAARQMAVPILMYHVLGTPPAGASLPELWVSKDNFRRQLAVLAKDGYQAVTLKAVFGAWTRGGPLPRKPVVLSFDDGYLSQATIAAPAMRRYGWPGVLNVTTHNLGPDGLPRHLATQLAREGWEFDSHTVSHPDLRTISDAQLRRELTQSRREIATLVGSTPQFFCYPAGKYDARVVAAVRAAGYAGATTVDSGVARRSDDPFTLPRLRITNADRGGALLARLMP
ncbi:MAG: polysaccharide deacetylase family protein [Patulibacter sp.]